MGCTLSHSFHRKNTSAVKKILNNPHEITLVSLYPEQNPNFYEINTLTIVSTTRQQQQQGTVPMMPPNEKGQESPSQMFLPANTEVHHAVTEHHTLDLNIADIISMEEFNEDENDVMILAARENSFALTAQLLLPSTGSLKSTNSGVAIAVKSIMNRGGSGRLSDYFLQGRSMFQSPVAKLSHPFEFSAQYSPKRLSGNFHRKSSFEMIH